MVTAPGLVPSTPGLAAKLQYRARWSSTWAPKSAGLPLRVPAASPVRLQKPDWPGGSTFSALSASWSGGVGAVPPSPPLPFTGLELPQAASAAEAPSRTAVQIFFMSPPETIPIYVLSNFHSIRSPRVSA